MTNDQLVDFLGPVAQRHDAALDRYSVDPSPANEALVYLYAAELCNVCFHGCAYRVHVELLFRALAKGVV